MRRLIVFVLVAVTSSTMAAGIAELPSDLPEPTRNVPTNDRPSSNWVSAVKAAVPAQYWANADLNFQQMTNLLREQSQAGNWAAKRLWGWVLIGESDGADGAQDGLQCLKDSAGNGCVPAMNDLGAIYESGKYAPTNDAEAFRWFKQAAAAGNAQGELQLGACYHYGIGTAPDLTNTVKLYRQAAMQTNYVAMKSLGYLLMNGLGTDKDPDAAKYWFTRAAKEGGNRRAMFDLGAIYAARIPDTNAAAEAFQWYRRGAELGDPLAALQLAEFYRYGLGTQTNLTRYHEWIFNAATFGSTEVQYELGLMYQTGDGITADINAALIWYRQAAAKNHPDALYNLGMYYLKDVEHPPYHQGYDCLIRSAEGGNSAAQYECAILNFIGDVGPPDFEKGKQWLTEAASNGWNQAEFDLFKFYYNGVAPAAGSPKFPIDRPEAIKWLRRAADHGNLQAQEYLGLMLVQGIGMDRGTWEGMKWLKEASEYGYAPAQNDLGYTFLRGDLGLPDRVQAAKWLELAQSHWDNPKTRRMVDVNLSNALAQLNADQKVDVAQEVKNFQPLPVPNSNPLATNWDQYAAYQREDGQFGH
ncbi:MAG TPA: hypothetical protein VH280_03345 [Verrucomicrobiae bacterium]|nr:hypothetical protein [Verrucomicrobiae bacterium]